VIMGESEETEAIPTVRQPNFDRLWGSRITYHDKVLEEKCKGPNNPLI
jgi:hypothetical protein